MNKQELLAAYNQLTIEQICHNCNNCDNCYKCNSCRNCDNCNNCYNCHNCNNCDSCILCNSLTNKTSGFYLLNKEVTETEFLEAKKELGYND